MIQQLLQDSNAGYSDPAAAPVLNGDDGDNEIVGEDGGQRINGGDGNDLILGGDGADLLKHIEPLDFDDRTVILDDTGDTPPGGGGGGEGEPASETADHFYLRPLHKARYGVEFHLNIRIGAIFCPGSAVIR